MKSALSLDAGSIFARDFRIERLLAEGGMGAVYIVQQISTGRRRALKVMQPELVQNDDLRRRFVLEAKIGASIASEHVVEVHLAGVDERTDAPYLVMELLDGMDLATRLEQRGPLSLDETRELFRQMCHALHLAHQAGIVHRDLKPPNVFLAAPKRAVGEGALGESFHVKVLDFGIAKMTHDATVGGAKTGVVGTPLWMAPEQADHVPVSPAADVWALGLMLYTSLTGLSFWRNGNAGDGVSIQQIFREMLFDAIPRATGRAREQGVSFPAGLDWVIAGSIVRRPAERFADAGAFFAALEGALEGKAAPSPDLSQATPFGGAMLAAPDFDMDGAPPLELAIEPSRAAPIPSAAPSPHAATLAAPLPFTAPPPATTHAPAPGRALLTDGRTAPWWLFYALPVAVVALFAAGAYAMLHPTDPIVECRLCTVEKGTYANGNLPLRQLRHDIEADFPRLETLCVNEAERPGRAELHWVVEGGDVGKRPTVQGGGQTGLCLLNAITRRPFAITDGKNGIGRTEVTYILEWNPSK